MQETHISQQHTEIYPSLLSPARPLAVTDTEFPELWGTVLNSFCASGWQPFDSSVGMLLHFEDTLKTSVGEYQIFVDSLG